VDPALSSAIDDAVAEALDPPLPAPEPVSPPPEKKKAVAKKAAKKGAKAVKASKKKEPTATAPEIPTKRAPAKKQAAKKLEAQMAPAPRAVKKRSAAPPPAVNDPLSFINFVAAFKVGSTVSGEVVSFTSHGAMVDVELPDGGFLHCYIPLSAMGVPVPTKAREVLKKGEVRPFVLAGLDPPRRVAELAIPAPPAKKRRAPAKKAAKPAS